MVVLVCFRPKNTLKPTPDVESGSVVALVDQQNPGDLGRNTSRPFLRLISILEADDTPSRQGATIKFVSRLPWTTQFVQ
jgi:hypothetical protein